MSGDLSSVGSVETDDRRDWVECVHFRLGDDAYEVELGRVKRIVRNPSTTAVPQTDAAIAGVSNLGGEIAVVVDARALFDRPARPPEADSVLVLLERGASGSVGLLVDDVPGIDPHHVEDIVPPADVDWNPPVGRHLFRAVVTESARTDRPVGVLDVDAILTAAREQ